LAGPVTVVRQCLARTPAAGVFSVADIHLVDKIKSAFLDYALPADLKVMLVLLAADLGLIYLPFFEISLFKGLLSLPILFFIPGFCCLAALFPRDGDLRFLGRLILSVGVSGSLVLLLSAGLYFSPWAVQLDNLIVFLAMISAAFIAFAHYRRAMLRNQDMVKVQFTRIVAAVRDALLPPGAGPRTRLARVILALVFLAMLIGALVIIIFPVNVPYTEFFILDANLKAKSYPQSLVTGQDYPVYLGVKNHENRDVTYTIEIWNVHTDLDPETNRTRIAAMTPASQVVLNLGENETQVLPVTLSAMNLDDNRIAFLLFNETVPGPLVTGSDRVNASYRNLYLGISVRPGFFSQSPAESA
jgi:uncharacterized membrane protein